MMLKVSEWLWPECKASEWAGVYDGVGGPADHYGDAGIAK